MPGRKPTNPKLDALDQHGTRNLRPERVRDELFLTDDFFDPHDLVQVRYEMLRRVRRDRGSVSDAVALFGYSRPSYYKAERDFQREGLAGLIPRKRGPRGGHRLTDEILDFVQQGRSETPGMTASAMAGLVHERFGVRIHPSSIERALARRKKKLP